VSSNFQIWNRVVLLKNIKNGEKTEINSTVLVDYSTSVSITNIPHSANFDDCCHQLLELQWLYDDSRLYPREL
jgi:hypothetical protein